LSEILGIDQRIDGGSFPRSDVRTLTSRQCVLLMFLIVTVMTGLIYRTGALAKIQALKTQKAWKQARSILPVSGCGICGQLARYDVYCVQKKQGSTDPRRHLGLRCGEHREAESIPVESGLYSALMLEALAILVFSFAVIASIRSLILRIPPPFWPKARMRPIRAAGVLASTLTFGLASGYILWADFSRAYLTLPLWMSVGGLLCVWLCELLVGGDFIHCSRCSFSGNLEDLRYFDGDCPGCGSREFRVQELLQTQRSPGRTLYRYRTMSSVSLVELEELEKNSRIWKEPRGAWHSASETVSQVA